MTVPDPWNLPSSASVTVTLTRAAIAGVPDPLLSYQVSSANGESITLSSTTSLCAAKKLKNSRSLLAMFSLTDSDCIRDAKEGKEHILHVNE